MILQAIGGSLFLLETVETTHSGIYYLPEFPATVDYTGWEKINLVFIPQKLCFYFGLINIDNIKKQNEHCVKGVRYGAQVSRRTSKAIYDLIIGVS